LRSQDAEIVVDALWALSFLSQGPDHRQNMMVAIPDLVKGVVNWLGGEEIFLVPALKVCGNLLSTGEAQAADVLIGENVIEALLPLLNHTRRPIRKEVCWSLSNIFGGTTTQINRCLVAGTLVPLLEIIHLEISSPGLKKEAQWCIANFAQWMRIKRLQSHFR
jgi:hypothetical protein